MKSFTWFWVFVLVSIQFFYFSNGRGLNISDSKLIYFIVATLISLLVYGIDISKCSRKLFPVILLPLVAFYKIPDVKSVAAITQLVGFTSVILLFIQVLTKDIDIKMLKIALGASCILQSIWIIGDAFGYSLYSLLGASVKFHGLPGSFANQGYTGCFIAVTAPFLFTKKLRWFLPLSLTSLILIHNEGTTTPIAVFLTILVLWLVRHRSYIQTLGFAVAGTLLVLLADNVRFMVWDKITDADMFWKGRGLGWITDNFKFFFHINKMVFEEVHNEYLEIVFSLGIWSLILFVFAILAIWKKSKSELTVFKLTAYGILLSSVSWHILHRGSVLLVAAFAFALLLKDTLCCGEIGGNLKGRK